MAMDADQILAFRLARSGLAARDAAGLAAAAACPASDFSRDAALLALAARSDDVTREGYDAAVDAGDLVVAHIVRGAIHALAPDDLALYGRALIARDDDELGPQLGRQVQKLAAEKGFAPTDALDEVAAATADALKGGRALDKNDLHEELRGRVHADLMPWCKGCGATTSRRCSGATRRSRRASASTPSAATSRAGRDGPRPRARPSGASCGSTPRPGRATSPSGPVSRGRTPSGCGTRPRATSPRPTARAWSCARTRPSSRRRRRPRASASCRRATRTSRRSNRPLLAPTTRCASACSGRWRAPARCCATAASPASWRMEVKGRRATIKVEKTGRLAKGAIGGEAERIGALRGAPDVTVEIS